jgi:hypothetical protein
MNRQLLPKTEEFNKLKKSFDRQIRNNAASARFRARRKLQDQQLRATFQSVSQRCDQLETRISELEIVFKLIYEYIVGDHEIQLTTDTTTTINETPSHDDTDVDIVLDETLDLIDSTQASI